ncbi:sodium/glutamate symporter [Oceanimonas smirnovii]|uniref:sodium/glutamate symporter n=1 Tax=Oceanimonas smirnovii TaxID=264574 RepID=UPI003770038E
MESSFHGVIAFALMAGMLLIGGLLRNRFVLLRRSLVPASIIGGLIGFTLLSLNLLPGFTAGDFSTLTFHFFTLSFMSLCLTGRSKDSSLAGGSIVRGGLWLTLIWTVSLGLQGVIGYGVITGYDWLTGGDISAFLGAIVTHGFTQGPGQALTFGSIWESQYGIENAAQVGMIYASIGFLIAFVVGVPWARRVIRRQQNLNRASRIDDQFESGFYNPEQQPASGRQVTHGANMDSLAFHLGLLAVAYVLTHLWLLSARELTAGLSPLGINLDVLFSHNMFFIHGLGVSVLMRLVIDKAGLSARVDDETLKRITGSSVDFMVVGTLMSIKFAVLYALLTPILLVSLVITLVTLFGCWWMGRLSGRLGHERAITAFGCCCGSTGTGLLLLRMLDADFSTSVPKELAFFNLAIVLANLHLIFIFAPMAPSLSPLAYLMLFGGTALLALAMVPVLKSSTRSDQALTCIKETL